MTRANARARISGCREKIRAAADLIRTETNSNDTEQGGQGTGTAVNAPARSTMQSERAGVRTYVGPGSASSSVRKVDGQSAIWLSLRLWSRPMAAWDQGRSVRTRSKFVAQRRKTPSKKRERHGERDGIGRTGDGRTEGGRKRERTTHALRYAQETTRGGVAMSLEVALARNRVYLRAHTKHTYTHIRVCAQRRERA